MSRLTNNSIRNIFILFSWIALAFLLIAGGAMVVLPIRPFWVDEWFIIYNLKTKSASKLCGKLELMQQFPRAYLVLIKCFGGTFNYSYTALRLLPYLVSVVTVGLSTRVTRKLFPRQTSLQLLFTLTIASSFTFTEYYVQTKQYSMDLFLGIVALWQLIEIHRIATNERSKTRMPVLLLSLLFAPFFSYTYSLSVVPVLVVAATKIFFASIRNHQSDSIRTSVAGTFFAIAASITGIAAFYLFDAHNLSKDSAMYTFWNFLVFDPGHGFTSLVSAFYRLFAQVGAGLVFETLFGILGILGLLAAIRRTLRNFQENSLSVWLELYAVVTIVLTLLLYLLRKLPVGTPRLNAFTVPAIILLVILLIKNELAILKNGLVARILKGILIAGLAGNLFSTTINYLSKPAYQEQMKIYRATESALHLAELEHAPLMITKYYTHPWEVAANPDGAPEPGVWALKTFPAYNMHSPLTVYSISDTGNARDLLKSLPDSITKAVAGDGIHFRVIFRN